MRPLRHAGRLAIAAWSRGPLRRDATTACRLSERGEKAGRPGKTPIEVTENAAPCVESRDGVPDPRVSFSTPELQIPFRHTTLK